MSEVPVVKLFTSKEMKARARPIFAENYSFYYPIKPLEKKGFVRRTCKCSYKEAWESFKRFYYYYIIITILFF
jgi:hypothetical protein